VVTVSSKVAKEKREVLKLMSFRSECWCGDSLAGISKKLDDTECNYPCEGNETIACGGALKLTLYRTSAAPAGMSVSGLLAIIALTVAWVS
jgi:hypothetical protein